MTRLVVVVAGAAALVTGCGDTGVPGQAGPTGWPGGRTFLSTSVTENGTDRPLVAGTRIMLSFTDDDQLGSQAGCNHIGGTARVDGGVLVVGAQYMTEMACDEPRSAQETWWVGFLNAGPTFRLDGDELTLTGAGAEIRFLDRRVADPDRPLAGTRWVVDTIITGSGPDGAASSVPAGLEAYLVFDGRDGFTGSTGCTPLGGSAVVSGDRITITASPVPACDSGAAGAAELHAAVLAALGGDVEYQIEAARLTLVGPTGAGLGLRAAG